MLGSLLVLASALSCGKADSTGTIEQTYTFHPAADRLLALMFPRRVTARSYSKAYVERGRPPAEVVREGDLTQYHMDSAHPTGDTPFVLDRGYTPLESWLLTAIPQERKEELLERAVRAEAPAREILAAAPKFRHVLEKAFFQRDVYQMAAMVHNAVVESGQEAGKEKARGSLQALSDLWKSLLLSRQEYEELSRLRTAAVPCSRYVRENRHDLRNDYLPDRVFGPDDSWIEIPFAPAETHHFKAFRGRSFFRVYIRVPGFSQRQFHEYWDEVHAKFGREKIHSGGVRPLPAGTEVLLLRTFAVHLKTGECADGLFPEEVIMRSFRYESEKLDLESSDFRGTYLYQYKGRRRDLLDRPHELGLVRTKDDDPSFFGMLTDMPGLSGGSVPSLIVTTMRNSCISCHSEMFYGIQTVFSLARPRPRASSPQPGLDSLLLDGSQPGYYLLRDPFRSTLDVYFR